jgi:hypothetical protein
VAIGIGGGELERFLIDSIREAKASKTVSGPENERPTFLLGHVPDGIFGDGVAREVSREEMMGSLNRTNEEGMVLRPENTQDPKYIRCCCGCCCALLSTVKKLPRPAEYFESWCLPRG